MIVQARRTGALLGGLFVLALACVRPPLTSSDAAGTCLAPPAMDGAQPFFRTNCSGVVTATGPTPAGDFTASTVDVDYHCGTIYVVLVDAAGALRLTLSFPFRAEAGAAGALGERTATVVLDRPPGEVLVDTTGSVTLTMIDDPLPDPDAGRPSWGIVAGTFSVDAGCLAISGSFRSQYCGYDSLCG